MQFRQQTSKASQIITVVLLVSACADCLASGGTFAVDTENLTCKSPKEGLLANGDIVVRFAPALPNVEVRLGYKDGSSATLELTAMSSGGSASFQMPADLSPEHGLTLTWSSSSSVNCDGFKVTSKPKPVEEGTNVGASGRARSEWQKSEVRKVAMARLGLESGAQLAVHFGSGRALDVPHSITEGTAVQVVIFSSEPVEDVELKVTSCSDQVPFRVGAGDSGETQGAKKVPAFSLTTVGTPTTCGAGTLSYELRVGEITHTFTIKVRTKSHLTLAFVPGWSFNVARTIEVENGSVTQVDDRRGPGLWVGGMWHPGGIDYENLRWWNHLLNPFVALDVEAPTSSFAIGNGFTVSGGLYLSIGVAVAKVVEPKGFALGQSFVGNGTVATRSVWSTEGVNLFAGICLDSDIYQAMTAAIQGASKGNSK